MLDYDNPKRTKSSGNKTIRTYAAALQKQHSPPNSYLQAASYQKHAGSPLIQPHKRIMVDTTREKYEKVLYEQEPSRKDTSQMRQQKGDEQMQEQSQALEQAQAEDV
eukprot:13733705-Ditylum_brightwellii.AAC.1